MKREMVLGETSPSGHRHHQPRREPLPSPERDGPVDLRKRCVVDRGKTTSSGEESLSGVGKDHNTYILASLLQNKLTDGPDCQVHNTDDISLFRDVNSKSSSRLAIPEFLDKCMKLTDKSGTKYVVVPVDREYYTVPSLLEYGDRRNVCSPLPPRVELDEKDLLNRNERDPAPLTSRDNEMHLARGQHHGYEHQRNASAFRRVASHNKAVAVIPESPVSGKEKQKQSTDNERTEFVPNYRKFYSRCSNQARESEKKKNLQEVVQPPTKVIPEVAKETNAMLKYKLGHVSVLKRSSSCSLVFPFDTPDGAGDPSRSHSVGIAAREMVDSTEDRFHGDDLRHSLKRRLTLPLRGPAPTRNASNDTTLRCLLQAPPVEKRVRSQKFANSDFSENVHDLGREHSVPPPHRREGSLAETRKGLPLTDLRVITPDEYLHAVNKYYLHVLHSFSGLPVLQRLLSDSDPPKSEGSTRRPSAPPLLPSGSPDSLMSSSPGSESTSSGSTDSGVFSDLAADDVNRRRTSRALTGKHVRSGTGASPATLRSLRQMIEERRRIRNVCKP